MTIRYVKEHKELPLDEWLIDADREGPESAEFGLFVLRAAESVRDHASMSSSSKICDCWIDSILVELGSTHNKTAMNACPT